MDPTWQPAVEELTQRRETNLARAKEFSTHAWFAAPVCKKRYVAVSERMATAGARAKARREDLKVLSVDGKACLATCPKRDDEAARTCREACKQRWSPRSRADRTPRGWALREGGARPLPPHESRRSPESRRAYPGVATTSHARFHARVTGCARSRASHARTSSTESVPAASSKGPLGM